MATPRRNYPYLLPCAAAVLFTAASAHATPAAPSEAQPEQEHRAAGADWLERRASEGTAESMNAGVLGGAYLTPHNFAKIQATETHGKGHLPRADKDLSAELSAVQRYGLEEETEILDGDWWLPALGFLSATLTGVLMYARNPLSRKRKYRRTPHEPYGPYRKRG
ncbi:hypothetical protein [Pseudoduganella namucuonensis]|uniref:Uncharacterized protein n=1 Tax=Pseudoduganella namucuonensis TaxID=1035707 RepID=A0A1I7H982_9BURK|nr:hypothetical protein [Pseudoduganella namucuonensis]SFU57244.1 hypothetical protein SAMN05216552_100579 [Pseudoduganella namucuonensis]